MKRLKKPLSFLLAAIMAMSVCAVGFSVFAADPDEIAELSEKIEAATTVDAGMISKVKALTADEKELLTAKAYAKVYEFAFNAEIGTNAEKEAAAIKAMGDSKSGPAAKDIISLLNGLVAGDLPTVPANVLAVDAAAGTEPTPTEAYKFVNQTGLSSYTFDAAKPVTIQDGNNKVTLTADAQKTIANYVLKAYNDGTERAKDLAEFMTTGVLTPATGAGAYAKFNAALGMKAANAAIALQKKANGNALDMTKVTLTGLAKAAYDSAKAAGEQFKAYNDAGKPMDKFAPIKAWNDKCKTANTVEAEAKLFTESLFSNGTATMGTATTLSSKITAEETLVGYRTTIEAFIKASVKPMDAAKYDTLVAASNAYKKMIADAGSKISPKLIAEFKGYAPFKADYDKFCKLLKEAGFNTAFEAEAKLAEFEAEKAAQTLPDAIKDIAFESILPRLPELGGLIQGLVLNLLQAQPGTPIDKALESLYTNENITIIAREWSNLLSPILQGILPGVGIDSPVAEVFALQPNVNGGMAIAFTVSGYATSNAQEMAIASALGKFTEKQTWNDVPNNAIDWGVTNYDTFMTRLLQVTLGMLNGSVFSFVPFDMNSLMVGSYTTLPDGSTDMASVNPAAYDRVVIPLFQALGVADKDIMPQKEYMAYIQSKTFGNPFTSGTPTNWAGDYFRPVMDTLFQQVIPNLYADPVNYLAKVLPELAYGLTDGQLLEGIVYVIDHGMIDIGGMAKVVLKDILYPLLGNPTEITFDVIWNLISPLLSGLGINISADDIRAFAHLGTAKIVDTIQMSAKDGKTVEITADPENVLTFLVNALGGLLPTLIPGLDFNVQGEFVKQEAPQYPHNGKMDKKIMNTVVSGLDGMLGGLVKIDELINNGLCTEEMAATAATAIYGLIGELDLSSLGIAGLEKISLITPKMVAAMLTEEKYDDLATDLNFDSWADVALTLKNDDGVIHQTKMGFKNGDRQGFIDCVVAMLRPISALLGEAGLLTNHDGAYGKPAYGLYETLIIPVFEAIGLTPAATSATYSENYRKLALKEDKNQAYDYLLKTILAPVLGLLNDLAAAPAATLMKLLPNVAYALQYNPQLAFIGNLLRNDAGEIDLAGMLNGLIGGLIPGFELPAISLDALASRGTITEKDSKSALHTKYTTVVADPADTFVAVYYYLYDTINYKGNMDTLKKMLSEIKDLDPALMGLINSLLNEIFTASKEESLCKLGALLASDVWECPDAKAADGNSGKKTPSTGDYAIPAAAFLAVMFSAGAAIVLLKKKKATVAE